MVKIALVGCSKTKRVKGPSVWAPAREVYCSDLFRKRAAYVEANNLPWYIISAGSWLLHPDTDIRTYDRTLSDFSEIETAEWHLQVAGRLIAELECKFGSPKLSSVTVEIHAGRKYCDPLGKFLELLGVKVVRPVASLGIGQQLAFYSQQLQAAGKGQAL